MSPSPEREARQHIDAALEAAGWAIQDRATMNLTAAPGVAVREFKMAKGHGFADYLLFVNGKAIGALEAKPAGYRLANVELQAGKYATGLPGGLNPPVPQALWLYGLVGFAQGGSYAPAIMLVAQQLPPARRGAGVGWVLAGMSAGYVGSISLSLGLIALFDYRIAFLACALGTVVGAVLGTMAVARVANRIAGPPLPAGRASLVRDRRARLLTMGYMGHCWELFGMWAWAPAFLVASLGDRFALGAVGLGIAIAMALHLSAFVASITMGGASDRYGRRAVLLAVAVVGALCSFGFGWSGALPASLLLAFAALYGFAALGDTSVLSAAMSEAVPADYLGRALAVRSILGIGMGAAAPAAFGVVLDLSAPGQGWGWGWGFALMGLGGVFATVCAALLPAASPRRGQPPTPS
jgi:MFS family permease